jgi:hypothetical protein
MKPTPKKPRIIMAQVDGSGTAGLTPTDTKEPIRLRLRSGGKVNPAVAVSFICPSKSKDGA